MSKKKSPKQPGLEDIFESWYGEPSSKKSKEEEENLFDKKAKYRLDSRKGHLHIAILVMIWAILLITIALIFVRGWHFLMPADSFWLTKTQLQEMDNILFSGVMGAVLGRYLATFIETHKDDE